MEGHHFPASSTATSISELKAILPEMLAVALSHYEEWPLTAFSLKVSYFPFKAIMVITTKGKEFKALLCPRIKVYLFSMPSLLLLASLHKNGFFVLGERNKHFQYV